MNYRHSYHAGNFSDVFKHVVLIELIHALQQKPAPFCYLETHAGAGFYDLTAENAQKTLEYVSGIERLWQQKALPAGLEKYTLPIKNANPDGSLRYYPGSPLIAHSQLRPADRMVLIELQPEAAMALKQEFRREKQVAVHQQDGYQGLKAFLPPPERRGLVFIDPPFEAVDEFDRLLLAVDNGLKRWPSGVYAIWLPIKNRSKVSQFYQALAQQQHCPMLLLEFAIYPEDSPMGLNACGMVIINPPWQLDKKLAEIVLTLWGVLSPDKLGGTVCKWLVI